MLVRLTAEQISKYWEPFRETLIHTAVPVAGIGPDRLNKALAAALSGDLQCWAGLEDKKFKSCVITQISEESATGLRSLVIYAMADFEPVQLKTIAEGFTTLEKFAKGAGCAQVVAYIADESVVKLAAQLGMSRRFFFCAKEV